MEKEQKKGVLYFLYENIDMAILATEKLLSISNDEKLRENLAEDLKSLQKFADLAVGQANGKFEIKGLSDFASFNAELGIDMKTMMDDSTEKLTELLSKGYKKGIETISQNIENSDGESEEAINLAKGYLEFCKQNLSKYKGLD